MGDKCEDCNKVPKRTFCKDCRDEGMNFYYNQALDDVKKIHEINCQSINNKDCYECTRIEELRK